MTILNDICAYFDHFKLLRLSCVPVSICPFYESRYSPPVGVCSLFTYLFREKQEIRFEKGPVDLISQT